MFAGGCTLPSNNVGVPLGQVQVLALQVDAVPAAAASESVYPVLQALQSTCSAVSQSVPALPSNNVGVPLGQVQILIVQIKVLN